MAYRLGPQGERRREDGREGRWRRQKVSIRCDGPAVCARVKNVSHSRDKILEQKQLRKTNSKYLGSTAREIDSLVIRIIDYDNPPVIEQMLNK